MLSSMRVVVASVCDVGDGAEWHCMNQTEPRTLVICLWALVLWALWLPSRGKGKRVILVRLLCVLSAEYRALTPEPSD